MQCLPGENYIPTVSLQVPLIQLTRSCSCVYIYIVLSQGCIQTPLQSIPRLCYDAMRAFFIVIICSSFDSERIVVKYDNGQIETVAVGQLTFNGVYWRVHTNACVRKLATPHVVAACVVCQFSLQEGLTASVSIVLGKADNPWVPSDASLCIEWRKLTAGKLAY